MRDAHALGRDLVVDPCSRERRGAAPSEIFHRWTSIRNRFLLFDENDLSLLTFLAAALVTLVWARAVEKGYSPFAGRTDWGEVPTLGSGRAGARTLPPPEVTIR
jgi:hypothetical protein